LLKLTTLAGEVNQLPGEGAAGVVEVPVFCSVPVIVPPDSLKVVAFSVPPVWLKGAAGVEGDRRYVSVPAEEICKCPRLLLPEPRVRFMPVKVTLPADLGEGSSGDGATALGEGCRPVLLKWCSALRFPGRLIRTAIDLDRCR